VATRRNFFKYLGLAGGVAGGGIVATEYGELAPPNGTISFGPKFVPGTEKRVTASMTVGPDGEMYLMTNGKWRRIVTE